VSRSDRYDTEVAFADYHVGRLLDFLKSLGELDNTLVMVISDNGASSEGGPTALPAWRTLGSWPYGSSRLGDVTEAYEQAVRDAGYDLAVTTDFRDVFGEIVVRHLAVKDPAPIFPGYTITPAKFPGFLA